MPARSSASVSTRVLRLMLVVLVAALVTAPAFAQITAIQPVEPVTLEDEEEYPWLLLGITGFAGAAGVDMKDLNNALRAVNTEIARQGSSGIKYDTIGSTQSLGGGIRAVLLDRYVLQAEYERLSRNSKVGGVTSNSEVLVPADVYTVTLGYDLLAKHTLAMGAGAGVAWYTSKAEQVVRRTRPGRDEETLGRVKLDGSTAGAFFQAFFEAKFTDRLYVNVTGGYRIAKVEDVEITGVKELEAAIVAANSDTDFIFVPVAECVDCDTPMPPPGEEAPEPTETFLLRGGGSTLDWSGLTGRVSLTFYLNMPTF
ncbi:MAG: hypothetical protein DHS20C21_09370 [Gemmatimonadota bacterium]|nr:MAG: hypothetical protein DHS20C21_09370 [Gemmatimonadota bacterium]